MVFSGMIDGTVSIPILRGICKIYKLSNYSKQKKEILVKRINEYLSILRIQKFIRNKLGGGKDCLCPISMESIKYPCFPFKPKGSTHFIYYNLESLIDYLLQTGDFRDPKTREPYLDSVLHNIDEYKKKVGLKGKSVLLASQNRSIYKKKKDHEDDIMVLERCIDEVVSSITTIMEATMDDNPLVILNSYHFPTYLRYYKRLFTICKFSAKNKIQNTIMIIIDRAERNLCKIRGIEDFILQFMYSIETTYESQFT